METNDILNQEVVKLRERVHTHSNELTTIKLRLDGMNDNCPTGVKHEQQIHDIVKTQDIMLKDVREIKEKLLARPSWTTTVIITFLSTLAFSALTFAFTVIKEYTSLLPIK